MGIIQMGIEEGIGIIGDGQEGEIHEIIEIIFTFRIFYGNIYK